MKREKVYSNSLMFIYVQTTWNSAYLIYVGFFGGEVLKGLWTYARIECAVLSLFVGGWAKKKGIDPPTGILFTTIWSSW